MKTFKVRALVLREYEAGESDKRLILLGKGTGKFMAYARGVRKPKSKLMAASQICAYGDFIIGDGGPFYTVTQAEVIEGFYSLHEDYDRLCYAHWMLEIADKTILENTPCDDLLLLLLKSLSYLAKKSQPPTIPSLAARVFLFRFFLFYGLAPETDTCCVCGGSLGEPNEKIPFCDEGTLCRTCALKKNQKTLLSHGALTALRYILDSDVTSAFRFKASDIILRELGSAGHLFWVSHFQIKLQSEALLAED